MNDRAAMILTRLRQQLDRELKNVDAAAPEIADFMFIIREQLTEEIDRQRGVSSAPRLLTDEELLALGAEVADEDEDGDDEGEGDVLA